MKTYSQKQVLILVLVIVAGISFLETSSAIWSLSFLKEFLLKFITYLAVTEFLVIFTGSFSKDS